MKTFIEGFKQGVAKALHSKGSADLLVRHATDPYVSNDELILRLAEHCKRFGIDPESREAVQLLRRLHHARPSLAS